MGEAWWRCLALWIEKKAICANECVRGFERWELFCDCLRRVELDD